MSILDDAIRHAVMSESQMELLLDALGWCGLGQVPQNKIDPLLPETAFLLGNAVALTRMGVSIEVLMGALRPGRPTTVHEVLSEWHRGNGDGGTGGE